jgi:hypothetical protein
MLGAFLIPIAGSNLRGLTHVLTCQQEAKSPFTLLVEEGQEPTILTALGRFERGEETALCGGLELNPQARSKGENEIEMILPIKNTSEYPWQGSVKLRIGDTSIPVRVGEIGAGETESATVTIPDLQGQTVVDGSLLIGP